MARRGTKFLILTRHGRYNTYGISDESRGLTETGREEVHNVARHLFDKGVQVKQILHSGKKRAEQTAEILAQSLNPSVVKAIPGLHPEDDPDELLHSIEMESESTLIVSHLPLLDRIAERIPGLKEYSEPVHFPQGGTLCFIRSNYGLKAQWMITPEMLQA